jgi:hypothetical protein
MLRKHLVVVVAAADYFALLVLRKLRWPSHLHAARLGAFTPLARAGADKLAPEFTKAAAHGRTIRSKHQLSARSYSPDVSPPYEPL